MCLDSLLFKLWCLQAYNKSMHTLVIHVWITMKTRSNVHIHIIQMFQFHTPMSTCKTICRKVCIESIEGVLSNARYALGGIYEPHKWLSVSHLVGGVDCGTCLEDSPHHIGMTLKGCCHQRSRPILWSSEGGESKVVPSSHVRCYYTAVCKSFPTSYWSGKWASQVINENVKRCRDSRSA